MPSTRYDIASFIADARKVLASGAPLADQKASIGEHLRELAKRDDLMRFGRPIGHSDASNFNWILYRGAPDLMLILVGWLPGFRSPVHEHGDYYVVGVGYAGHDRWDVFERLDDGSVPGRAELKLIDQWDVTPGTVVCMPPPPRAIHSHNNVSTTQMSYELLFTATPPLPPGERLIYDVEGQVCWPSYQSWDVFDGDWPPVPAASKRTIPPEAGSLHRIVSQRLLCPLCDAFARLRFRLPVERSA